MPNVMAKELFEAMLQSYLASSRPMFTPEMGIRLKTVREKLEMTQRELAERLGLNQTELSRLEGGKNINAMPSCAAFKSVLGGHFEYFLTRLGYYRYEDIKVSYNKQIRGKVFNK